jgi:hypothetical protein
MKNNPELKQDDIPPHQCWKNHEGSSGSMESAGALELVVEAFDKNKVVIKRLCCDDDSSIRADCQWSNTTYLLNNNTQVLPKVPISRGKNKGKLQDRQDKGKLPGHVPEPLFVADPNHRRKGLTGELIKLDTSKADTRMTMTRMDTTRIGKNFGYMARTLKDIPETQFVDAGKACLEHHFDCHLYCGPWCKRKDQTEEQRNASVKYYRSKEKDAKLYALLLDKLERFISEDRLKEMAHSLDTNMNEAFNQICTWFAPKNKVFAGSCSLPNRISCALGINSLGVEAFFKRLFKMMGVPLTPNVAYYLQTIEKSRVQRLEKLKTKESKKNKNKRKYDKLAKHTLQAKVELRKREGTYRRGMNLDEVVETEHPNKKSKRVSAAKYCEYCGSKDHLTRRAKNCTAKTSTMKAFNKVDGTRLQEEAHPAALEEEEEEVGPNELAQQDCDGMDGLPFDADYDSDQDPAALLLLHNNSDDADETSVGIIRATL